MTQEIERLVEPIAELLANQIGMRKGCPPIRGCLALMPPAMAQIFREDAHAVLQSDALTALIKREEERETWQSISDWCGETFGPASPLRMAARANEEMAELIDKATQTDTYDESVLIEAADVVICLARFPGIWDAVERKMAINRARTWRLTGEGTGYHVPAALNPNTESENL